MGARWRRPERPTTRRVRIAAAVAVAAFGSLGIVASAGAADDLVLAAPLSGIQSEVAFDSSGYTSEPGEITECPAGTVGGRSAWTRFDPTLSGTLSISVVSRYDAILHVYTTASTARSVIADLRDSGCTDADHAGGGGTESRSLAVTAGEAVYVQTLGVCPAPCDAPGAQTGAGATTVRLTLDPDDTDVDGVPDTLDACPATPGTQADGCPVPLPADADKDGVPDERDACRAAAGNLVDGCPGPLGGGIRGRWQVNQLQTKLLSLVVEAPLGSRINLRCSARARVCPFERRVIGRTMRRFTSLTRYFGERRVFPSDMSIFVRVTHTRRIGIYQHLRTRRGQRLPRVTRACIYPGARIQPCR